MSYVINNSRGNLIAVVADGTVNTTATSLALVGRALENYGTYENENYVYLLENFAKSTPPTYAVLGQLWYDSSTDTLSSYNTANTWSALASQDYVQAQKISPVFTGIPAAPTAVSGTATTQIATTAFVTNSPIFTGSPTAPTAPAGTANAQLATTAFVTASPVFTGEPTAPTADPGTATTQIATTEFVTSAVGGKETAVTQAYGNNSNYIATTAFVQNEKYSPIFTGVPRSTTAPAGTANSQIATTAYVIDTILGPSTVLGTMSQQNAGSVNILGGTITGISPLGVDVGGTGASTAATARTNLGLGSISTQNANSVSISGGTIFNITPLAVIDGGTGANTASTARTNLGLGSISTQNANSVNITGGTAQLTTLITANANITGGQITNIQALAISDGGTGATTAADARNNLSLGSMALQQSVNVDITGGSITGIDPLAVDVGGTGAVNLTGLVVGNGSSPFTTVTKPNGAIVGTTEIQTLSNKTLTNPIINSGTLDSTTTTSDGTTAYSIGYRNIPQNSQNSNYVLAAADVGKHIYSQNSGAQTITIPTNASVPFALGTAVTIVNNGTTAITISASGVTLYQAGTTNTGNRTLGVRGLVTIVKVATNTWFISGSGIS